MNSIFAEPVPEVNVSRRSTIFKRHLSRRMSQPVAKPALEPKEDLDEGLGATLARMNTRSSIFQRHDTRGQLREDEASGMEAASSYGGGSIFATLSRMASHSSIYDRNARRSAQLS